MLARLLHPFTCCLAILASFVACSLNPQPEPPMNPSGGGGAGFDAGAGGGSAGSPGAGGGSSGASGAAGSMLGDASDNPDACEGDNCKCDVDGGQCDAACDAPGDAATEGADGSPDDDADSGTPDSDPDALGQD